MRFWMVYVEDQEAPNFKHVTLKGAKAEAERLASFTKKKVYILEAVEYCECTAIKWSDISEDVPF